MCVQGGVCGGGKSCQEVRACVCVCVCECAGWVHRTILCKLDSHLTV